MTEYSLLFGRRENTNLDKLLKDCLLIEKLVAEAADALQRNSHSIANVDDLWRKLWRKRKRHKLTKRGKSFLLNYKYALEKYMIWKYYAKAYHNILAYLIFVCNNCHAQQNNQQLVLNMEKVFLLRMFLPEVLQLKATSPLLSKWGFLINIEIDINIWLADIILSPGNNELIM